MVGILVQTAADAPQFMTCFATTKEIWWKKKHWLK
jgi:hypothetical protein